MTQPSTHEVFPYLCVTDAGRTLEFYATVFGAVENFRLTAMFDKA